MKCNQCGEEIADDSVFCEFCGKKAKKSKTKSKKWLWIGAAGIGFCVVIICILVVLNINRWRIIYDNSIASWPPCHVGNDTFHILQDGYYQKLVLIKGKFPISLKDWGSTDGKIFSCEGEHSGLAAFALLNHDGRVVFVTNYIRSGLQDSAIYTSTCEEGLYMYSDENHIFGYDVDRVCGKDEEEVKMLFPSGLGQPVKIGNKWRYVEILGSYMLKDEFDDAYPFCHGRARVRKNDRWFYINYEGKEVRSKYRYQSCGDYHYDAEEGIVAEAVLRDNRHVLINFDGNIIKSL